MFTKKSEKMAKIPMQETKPNTIVNGTTIKGEIISDGDFRIDGTLIGSIKSKGKIVVGESGSIEGEVECRNADFSGRIQAKVIVAELLSLKATARITGDVITNKLSIEPGATFTGTCKMDGSGTQINQHAGQQSGKPEKVLK
ncbi:MAG: polymer-forming cytoskeletal protein [Bacteroidales bacterium]